MLIASAIAEKILGLPRTELIECSLPKAMSISRSEILRKKEKKKGDTEVEKLPSEKVREAVS